MKHKLFAGLGIAAAIGFLVGHYGNIPALNILTKPIPVFLMIFMVIGFERNTYRDWILVGLCFSVAGDIFLSAGESMFIYGLVYFLLGHIAFIVAYLSTRVPSAIFPLVIFTLWGAIAFWILQPNLGELMIPVFVYVVVICMMMWRAACLYNMGKWGRLAFFGALLFGISDTVLAIDRFHTSFEAARVLNILTYWGGQTLIALSACQSKE